MIYCTSEFPDLKLSCSVHPRVPLENGNTKEPSISAAGFWRSTPSPTAKTRYARPLRTLSTTNTSSYGRSFVLWSFVDRLCRDWNPLIPAILGCTTGIQTWLVDTFQLFDLPFHPFLVPIWGSQSQWDVDIVEGPGGSARWYGKIDWSIDLATRVRPYRILSSQRFVQRCTFDPSPLRVHAVICDLKAPVFLCRRWAFEIYWTCICMDDFIIW